MDLFAEGLVAAASTDTSQLCVRMMLSNANAGTIIGKGGSNIKGIRENSGCKVSIQELQPGATERLVSVTGPPLLVNQATELMLGCLEESLSMDTNAPPPGPEGHSHSMKLVLSNNQVGGIIGKGGATIKQFREETGAVIKVETLQTAGNERIVTLQGVKAAVVKAHLLTVLKIATIPEDRDAGNNPSKQQRTGGGRGGAAPLSGLPGLQQLGYGIPQGIPQAALMSAMYGAQGGIPGVPGQFAAQYGQVTPGLQGYQFTGAVDQGFTQSPAQAAAQQAAVANVPVPVVTVGGVEQLVPSLLIGRIIGRGGTGIRELRDMSRATIKISSDPEPGTDNRKVTITGSPEQTQLALQMLQQRIAQGP